MEQTPEQIRARREQAQIAKQDRKLEKELKTSHQQYATQLKDVQEMITNNPSSTELTRFIDVERVLKEALSITEESLLNLKKAQLLDQFSAANEEETEEEAEPSLFSEDHPVQALYTGREGTMWMEATVLKASKGRSVLIAYDTPLDTAMKTCRFISSTKNACRYGDQCKFSHGFLLPISSVRERKLEKLVQGGPCLAKFETDGLWYEGSIEKYIDEKTISVYYNGYDQTADLDLDDICALPPVAHKHDRKKGEGNYLNEHVEVSVNQQQRLVDSEFGDWQQHTKGFGLKMLEKFGFKPGEGLGRDGQGISEPVARDSQVHLPFSTSIDNAAADLEKMQAIRQRQDQKMKRKLQELSEPQELNNGSTFQYLDKLSQVEMQSTVASSVSAVKPKPRKSTPVDIRKKLRQLTDEIAQSKTELQANLNGYNRNRSNSELSATYKKKVQMIQSLIEKKQQEAISLQRSLTPAKKGIF